jgi:hypothetical protein
MPANDSSRIGKWSEQEVLERIEAIRRRAPRLRRAGVRMLAGDTKVVPRGKGDLLFVNTTGVGLVREPARLGLEPRAPGMSWGQCPRTPSVPRRPTSARSERSRRGWSSCTPPSAAPGWWTC